MRLPWRLPSSSGHDDLVHVEEAVAVEPDVDERRLHARQDVVDDALVDVPGDRAMRSPPEVHLGDLPVLEDRDRLLEHVDGDEDLLLDVRHTVRGGPVSAREPAALLALRRLAAAALLRPAVGLPRRGPAPAWPDAAGASSSAMPLSVVGLLLRPRPPRRPRRRPRPASSGIGPGGPGRTFLRERRRSGGLDAAPPPRASSIETSAPRWSPFGRTPSPATKVHRGAGWLPQISCSLHPGLRLPQRA